MPEEPRTEILCRRIELYLHCISEGVCAAQTSDFLHAITEAEEELFKLTAESTFRYDAITHGSR